jgi:hypothetical protein
MASAWRRTETGIAGSPLKPLQIVDNYVDMHKYGARGRRYPMHGHAGRDVERPLLPGR